MTIFIVSYLKTESATTQSNAMTDGCNPLKNKTADL